jgi:hypothetical protein
MRIRPWIAFAALALACFPAAAVPRMVAVEEFTNVG